MEVLSTRTIITQNDMKYLMKVNIEKLLFESSHGVLIEGHCVKIVKIWSFCWSVFSCIRTEYTKMPTRKLRIWTLFTQ